MSEELVVFVAASYVEPVTSTQAGGVAVLSNTKAYTLLPAVAVKLVPADMVRATGTANVVPSGPSAKTVLMRAAPVMPALLRASVLVMSVGS